MLASGRRRGSAAAGSPRPSCPHSIATTYAVAVALTLWYQICQAPPHATRAPPHPPSPLNRPAESICDPSSHHGRAAVIVPQRAVRVHAWDLPHRCASTTTVMHTVRHARIRWNSTPAAISTYRHPHWSSKPICTNNQDSVSPSPSQIANRAEHVIYLTTYMFLGP